jgi:hypothetical protein
VLKTQRLSAAGGDNLAHLSTNVDEMSHLCGMVWDG